MSYKFSIHPDLIQSGQIIKMTCLRSNLLESGDLLVIRGEHPSDNLLSKLWWILRTPIFRFKFIIKPRRLNRGFEVEEVEEKISKKDVEYTLKLGKEIFSLEQEEEK